MKTTIRVVLAAALFVTMTLPGVTFAQPGHVEPAASSNMARVAPDSSQPPSMRATASALAAKTSTWVVGVDPKKRSSVIRELKAQGLSARVASPKGNRLTVTKTGGIGDAAAVEAIPGVEYAAPSVSYTKSAVPTDPRYDEQYGLVRIGSPGAWDTTRGASSVTVAVVDAGVDLDHEDLFARVDTAADRDFVNGDFTAMDDDVDGHGTHVAGIAAASWGNSLGGVGVASECTILPIKVLDANGSGESTTVAAGIEWAADMGAQVINLSLGSPFFDPAVQSAIDYALAEDCVIVAAVGNDDGGPVSYPARAPGVLGVGAIDDLDTLATFSNVGSAVDVVAPGVGILSTGFDPSAPSHDEYYEMSGTSMATPFVAGAAALLRTQHPDWTQGQVRQALMQTASDLGPTGRDDAYGNGVIQIPGALALSDPSEPPTEITDPGSGADDEIPGVPAASNVVTGTLDDGGDWDDIYRVTLAEGDQLYASVSGEAGTNFDLYLYGPSAVSVIDFDNIVQYNEGPTYPNGLNWYVTGDTLSSDPGALPGSYYIDVAAIAPDAGAGQYTLTWYVWNENDIQQPVELGASSTTPEYAKSSSVYAYFKTPGGDPIPGEKLALVRYSSSQGGYIYVDTPPATTDAAGKARFSVTSSSKMKYNIVVDTESDLGGFVMVENGLEITPKVYLSTPYPTVGVNKVRAARTYTWQGFIKPKHIANRTNVVYLKTYRLINHKWVYYKTFRSRTANYSWYTKYRSSVRFPYRGKWRVIPYAPADSAHTKTHGPPRYITVR